MTILLAIALVAGASGSLGAQWFTYPSPRAPRTAGRRSRSVGGDSAAGQWKTGPVRRVDDRRAALRHPRHGAAQRAAEADIRPRARARSRTASFSRQSINIGIDMPGGLPYQPWLATLVDERTANQAIDDPHIRCLPDSFFGALRAPSLSEVRPDAGSAGDAERVQRHLPSGLHRRPAAAGGPESVVAGLFDGHLGPATRW